MQSARSTWKWFGVAAVACVACCAVPLVALFGIGGSLAGLGALFAGVDSEAVVCSTVFGAVLVALGYILVRKWKPKSCEQTSCDTACRIEGDCCESKETINIMDNRTANCELPKDQRY